VTNQWILRQTRSMQNPVFPGREPVAVPRDRPLILKYRLVIHQGDWTQLAWDKMYRAYAEGRVESGG